MKVFRATLVVFHFFLFFGWTAMTYSAIGTTAAQKSTSFAQNLAFSIHRNQGSHYLFQRRQFHLQKTKAMAGSSFLLQRKAQFDGVKN